MNKNKSVIFGHSVQEEESQAYSKERITTVNVESPISLRIVTCGSKKGKVCPTHGSECLEVVVASQPGTVLEGRLCFVSRVRRNPPYPKIFCCVFSGARMCIGQVNFPSICLKPSHIGGCAGQSLGEESRDRKWCESLLAFRGRFFVAGL